MTKILLVGLPKSGTSSFQYLFQVLGMKSYHWDYRHGKKIGTIMKENKENNRKLLEGIEDWDCITQMDVCWSNSENYWPQISDLERLYEENKDCIFILNRRAPEKILTSWKNWGKMDERLYRFNPELIEQKNDEGLLKWFENHFETVETFFTKTNRDSKFISFDIEKDSIEKLKKYIDIKEFKSFPKKNVSVNKKKN